MLCLLSAGFVSADMAAAAVISNRVSLQLIWLIFVLFWLPFIDLNAQTRQHEVILHRKHVLSFCI